jgi:hypothetical protein
MEKIIMINMKMLTAVAAIATLGIAAPVVAEDTTPPTTIHEESPRAGTDIGVDTESMAEDADASSEVPGTDDAVHSSAYKKTYPAESEVGE